MSTVSDLTKSELTDHPGRFSTYIHECPDQGLMALLDRSLDQDLDWSVFEPIAQRAYAPGKWTVIGVLQHMMDSERIFSYRALRIARGDTTPLPGFDENSYGVNAAGGTSDFSVALDEFRLLRRSTAALFRSFDPAWLHRRGTCSGIEISAGSLGLAINGITAPCWIRVIVLWQVSSPPVLRFTAPRHESAYWPGAIDRPSAAPD